MVYFGWSDISVEYMAVSCMYIHTNKELVLFLFNSRTCCWPFCLSCAVWSFMFMHKVTDRLHLYIPSERLLSWRISVSVYNTSFTDWFFRFYTFSTHSFVHTFLTFFWCFFFSSSFFFFFFCCILHSFSEVSLLLRHLFTDCFVAMSTVPCP